MHVARLGPREESRRLRGDLAAILAGQLGIDIVQPYCVLVALVELQHKRDHHTRSFPLKISKRARIAASRQSPLLSRHSEQLYNNEVTAAAERRYCATWPRAEDARAWARNPALGELIKRHSAAGSSLRGRAIY